MNKKITNQKLIIILIIFCVVIVLLSILFYTNLKNKLAKVTVEATIKYIGEDYMLISDDQQQDYTIPFQSDYNIGDRISATFKNLDYDKTPIEGDVIELKTISKTVSFAIQDSTSQNETSTEETVTIDESNNNAVPATTTTTDADVINYLEQLNYQLDEYTSDTSLAQSLKTGFITVVDFLFYNGPIKGKTFSELSDTAKLTVLKLALSIDQKIAQHFPNYKEEISTTSSKIYTNIKARVIETYLNITTSVCENNSDICQTAKTGLTELKNSFSLTWDFIKQISGISVSKLKSWYEVWKNC